MMLHDEYGRRYDVSHAAQPDAITVHTGRLLLFLCVGLFFAARFLVRLAIRGVHAVRARRAAQLAYRRRVLAEHDTSSVWR